MDTKASYTLVGLFVVLLSAALAMVIVWLSTTGDEKAYKTYIAYMYESVSGLSPRALVTYRGVQVGLVRRIALDKVNPERVELVLDIEEYAPIREDTTALLATQGITGIAHIELTGGSKGSPTLRAKPGEAYPVIQTKPSLLVRLDTAVSALLARVTQMASQFSNVAERVNMLLDDDKQKQIGNMLSNFAHISRTLAKRTGDMEHSLAAFSEIMTASSKAADQLPELVEQVNVNLAHLGDTIKSINKTTNRLGDFLSDSESNVTNFTHGALPQMAPLITELRQLATGLERITRDLQQHPDALLFGPPITRPGPGE